MKMSIPKDHPLVVFSSFVFIIAQFQLQSTCASWKVGIRKLYLERPSCRRTSYLADAVSMTFRLEREEECERSLFGSVSENCTAEISCTNISLPPPNSDGICEEGYIMIFDSFGSQLVGCGIMNFGGPFRPSRDGRNLYVRYKGVSNGTECFAYCGERRTTNLPYVHLHTFPKYSGRHVTKQCVCGLKLGNFTDDEITARIVNGEDAIPFEFPWSAAIVNRDSSINRCGGSLINDRYILTAAHCVVHRLRSPETLQILLHAHFLDLSTNKLNITEEDYPNYDDVKGARLPKRSDEDENRIRVNVSKVSVYPSYIKVGNGYPKGDVALLRLDRSLNLYNNEDNRIRPICIPKIGQVMDHAGNILIAIGWGKPRSKSLSENRILQKIDVPILSQRLCRSKLRHDFNRQIVDPWTSTMFCAGFGSKDVCSGDSGNPAFLKLKYSNGIARYTQIGIVSWGVHCASKTYPGVYTKLDELTEWVHKETHDAVWCDS